MSAALWYLAWNSVTVALLVPLALGTVHLFRDRPAVQHAVWLLLLLKFVTPPLIAWPWGIDLVPVNTRAVPEPVAGVAPREASIDPEIASPTADFDDLPLATQSVEPVTPIPSAAVAPQPPPVDWVGTLSSTLMAVWLTGAAVSLGWQLRSIWRQARLVRSGRAIPSELNREIASAAVLLGIAPPRTVQVRGVVSPFIWCWGGTRLVWPESLIGPDDLVRFRGIIAHELAHLRRRDHWIAWLELGVGIVWWWNPLFWFVRRRLRETAEMACDAMAIATNPDGRRDYAELLLELSAGFHQRIPTALAVGAGSLASFERRFRMILSDRVSGRVSSQGVAAIIGLALLALPHWSLVHSAPISEPGDQVVQPETKLASDVPQAGQSDPPSEAGPSSVTQEVEPLDLKDENGWGLVEVPGQVVDPNGKPVAGAMVFRHGYQIKKPALVAKTDSDGRFKFQSTRQLGPKRQPDDPESVKRMRTFPSGVTLPVIEYPRTDAEEIDQIKNWLLAAKPGNGFGYLSPGDGVTLQLAPDIPVTGRVTDQAGRPLAGARVRVRDVFWPLRAGDPLNALADRRSRRPVPPASQEQGLEPWLAAVRRAVNMNEYIAAREYLSGLIQFNSLGDKPSVYAPLIPAETSDNDGRFLLRGIGAERVAELYIDGVTDKASSLVVVVTRPLDEPVLVANHSQAVKQFIANNRADLAVYGATFETSLAAGRTIAGVVTDRATGLPVEGARVIGPNLTWLEYPGFDRFFATTDAEGYYRIEGFPLRTSERFVVDVPNDSPLFGRTVNLKIEAGFGPQVADFSLAKGVWITGKVVDDATGQGLDGETIEYHVFKDNPHLQKDLADGIAPQFGRSQTTERADNAGNFRIRGYPGRGIVTAGGGNTFLYGIGVEAIKGLKQEEFLESLYGNVGFSPYLRNTTIEVNIPEGNDPFNCVVRLKRGKSRQVHVVGPDGEPQSTIEASGLANQIQNPISEVSTSDFTVTNLYPGESREVVARYVPKKLMGMAIVTDMSDEPVTLTLMPWATVIGRLVDDQGNPRFQGLRIQLEDGKLPIHTVNGRNYDKEDFSIDPNGRFLLEGLVPGAKYRLQVVQDSVLILGDLTKVITLKPGEQRDLGDVKLMK
ncbi:MAG: hypothetical protein JSS49_08110 [Planctomycetes bacterium]|nr:hypothetical protein [Planctomycetota bacterium]